MSWIQLTSERQPELPLTLAVGDARLTITAWLRTLPGKRYVADAIWHRDGVDTRVLAKLYLGKRASAKMQAELAGCQKLLALNLPTPEIADSGCEASGSWLLLQWLDNAQTLAQLTGITVDQCQGFAEVMPQSLTAVIVLIAKMHSANILQQDLHLDNFLISGDHWHIIDAAELAPADEAGCEKNLAMLLAQLPHEWWPQALACYQQYRAINAEQVLTAARSHRLWRAQDLAAKSVRNCSLFQWQQRFDQVRSVWRDQADSLNSLLDDIEAVMASGKMLKDGGSSTVVLVQWHGQPLVIKRYNVKGVGHFMRRCLRQSRALHCWQQGLLWRVLQMPTPQPLAVLEKRWGPLRKGGYLVTKYSGAEDIISALNDADQSATPQLLSSLAVLLQRMAQYSLSHGDFKGTNILVSNECVNFIDLDAANCHSNRADFLRASNKDWSRLQRNWPKGSTASAIAALISKLVKNTIQT